MTDVKDITLEAAAPIKAVFQQGEDREARIPLTPLLSKQGSNVYWGIPQSRGMFGVQVVPPKGMTDLPNRVFLENGNGVTVGKEFLELKRGLTEDGRPKVSGSKVVTIPLGDTIIQRLLTVTISVTKAQTWNVKVSAIGLGGGNHEAISLFE